MSQIVIAKRYAKALFKLAQEASLVQPVQNDISAVAEAFRTSDALAKSFVDTKVPMASKRTILQGILEKLECQNLSCTFTQYLLNKRRIQILSEVSEVYSQFARDASNILEAEVTVAQEASGAVQAQIKAALEKASGKNVELSVTVNPELIGGMVTKVGSTVIDQSVRQQLTRMCQVMSQHA